MDCGNFDTDWADVSHGILLCIECSGKHRALGMYIYRNRFIYIYKERESCFFIFSYVRWIFTCRLVDMA